MILLQKHRLKASPKRETPVFAAFRRRCAASTVREAADPPGAPESGVSTTTRSQVSQVPAGGRNRGAGRDFLFSVFAIYQRRRDRLMFSGCRPDARNGKCGGAANVILCRNCLCRSCRDADRRIGIAGAGSACPRRPPRPGCQHNRPFQTSAAAKELCFGSGGDSSLLAVPHRGWRAGDALDPLPVVL